MTRLRHYDNLNTVRFVTFSCHNRLKLLTTDFRCNCLVEVINKLREEHQFKVFGYVIMPEHVHLVLLPHESTKLGRLIGEIKAKSATLIIDKDSNLLPTECNITRSGRIRQAFWLPRCYDHNCRTVETIRTKIIYCYKNPVTRGLVDLPESWIWSSYNWYQGVQDVPLKMDEIGELL